MDSEKQYHYRSYEAWSEAFLIFAKYEPDDIYAEVATEHDIIYAGCDPDLVSIEDKKRLFDLGWELTDTSRKCFHKQI